MKALQQISHGNPKTVVQLIDIPDPIPEANEIIITVEAAAVHLADIKRFRGDPGFKAETLPTQPGYEGVGIVSAIGHNVKDFKIGDRAFPWWGAGTFAQKICTDAKMAIPAPKGDALQLALMMVNGMTAICLLEDFATLKEGDWIIQNGANSSCGRYIITLAKERGIKTCNIVRRKNLFTELYDLGADVCVTDNSDPSLLEEEVKNKTKRASINIGFDLVAGHATTCIARCLAYGGKVVNYGFISKEPCSLPFQDLFFKNITLTGMSTGRGLAKRNKDTIRQVYSMLAEKISTGTLKAAIAGTYKLEEFSSAFQHAELSGEERNGKIIFQPNKL